MRRSTRSQAYEGALATSGLEMKLLSICMINAGIHAYPIDKRVKTT